MIKFIHKSDAGDVKNIKVVGYEGETWMHLMSEFRDFLNGVGYIIPRGEIIIKPMQDTPQFDIDFLDDAPIHTEPRNILE
jgi:hypothetical protein